MPAGAHAELVESDPPANGEIAAGTTSIELTLITVDTSEPVEVRVVNPQGENVATGIETDENGSRVIATVDVESLEEGNHVAVWRAIASDGDGLSQGQFLFEVTAAPSSGGPGIWLLWAVALAIPAVIFLRPGARKKKASGSDASGDSPGDGPPGDAATT